jgi:seryl-tRNA synthetase
MLDLKSLRTDPEAVRDGLARRGSDLDLDRFLVLDEKRRTLIQEVEELKAERNRASTEVAKRKRESRDASDLLSRLGEVSERVKTLDHELKGVDDAVQEWLVQVPNIPHASVPLGASEADNVEVRRWGAKPELPFRPKEHWELGPALGGLDFERSARITGARFALYWGWAARMERALITFMLDLHTRDHGYTEVLPPFIVNGRSLFGTGQLPKFEADLFKLEGTDYYLIPTAEVPVTNIHSGETLPAEALPLAYAAFTPASVPRPAPTARTSRG